jgi:hypothetical protein
MQKLKREPRARRVVLPQPRTHQQCFSENSTRW